MPAVAQKSNQMLDFIYTNQCTFYTQMYQSFKYTLKSLKTLYDSLKHVSISYEIIFRESYFIPC